MSTVTTLSNDHIQEGSLAYWSLRCTVQSGTDQVSFIQKYVEAQRIQVDPIIRTAVRLK